MDDGTTGKKCREDLRHTTKRRFRYRADVSADDPCPQPTAEEEAGVVDAAVTWFAEMAKAYCARGECTQGRNCVSDVVSIATETLGTVEVLTCEVQKDCYLEVRIEGVAKCACYWEKKPADP